MRNRKYYRDRFEDYPAVVTLPQFCEMMGGIADQTTRKLMRRNHVRHYYIRGTYLIPKRVGDRLCSRHPLRKVSFETQSADLIIFMTKVPGKGTVTKLVAVAIAPTLLLKMQSEYKKQGSIRQAKTKEKSS